MDGSLSEVNSPVLGVSGVHELSGSGSGQSRHHGGCMYSKDVASM